jgi:hypothetical protein
MWMTELTTKTAIAESRIGSQREVKDIAGLLSRIETKSSLEGVAAVPERDGSAR